MFVVAREWAESQVNGLENKESLNSDEKIMLSVLRRELLILDMLNLNEVNIIGGIESVKERLDNYEVLVVEKGLFEKYKKAYRNQKAILDIIKCIDE